MQQSHEHQNQHQHQQEQTTDPDPSVKGLVCAARKWIQSETPCDLTREGTIVVFKIFFSPKNQDSDKNKNEIPLHQLFICDRCFTAAKRKHPQVDPNHIVRNLLLDRGQLVDEQGNYIPQGIISMYGNQNEPIQIQQTGIRKREHPFCSDCLKFDDDLNKCLQNFKEFMQSGTESRASSLALLLLKQECEDYKEKLDFSDFSANGNQLECFKFLRLNDIKYDIAKKKLGD